MSPGQRIARPGPGNGCRPTKISGRPSSRPSTRTSSLNSSRKGSTSFMFMRAGKAADIVVRLDRHRRAAGERHALDHVGIERALRQEVRAADLLGFRIEHVDEQPPDGLALDFGVGDAFELAEELLRGINMHQRDVVVMPEQVDDGLGFIEPQHAVIDEHASELVADRLVDQHRRHGRSRRRRTGRRSPCPCRPGRGSSRSPPRGTRAWSSRR